MANCAHHHTTTSLFECCSRGSVWSTVGVEALTKFSEVCRTCRQCVVSSPESSGCAAITADESHLDTSALSIKWALHFLSTMCCSSLGGRRTLQEHSVILSSTGATIHCMLVVTFIALLGISQLQLNRPKQHGCRGGDVGLSVHCLGWDWNISAAVERITICGSWSPENEVYWSPELFLCATSRPKFSLTVSSEISQHLLHGLVPKFAQTVMVPRRWILRVQLRGKRQPQCWDKHTQLQ